MTTKKQQIAFRAQPEIYEKFKVIAEKNNRSVSRQIEFLMQQCIEKYELENGKIAPVINQQHNLFANAEINMSRV